MNHGSLYKAIKVRKAVETEAGENKQIDKKTQIKKQICKKKKNVSTLLAKIFKLAENKAPIKAMWSY